MALSVLILGPTLLCEGLRALLAQEEDLAVGIGVGHDFGDRPPPDVVVLCAEAPETVRDLRAHWPQTRLLVVADLSPSTAGRLMDLGVLGLYPLMTGPDELIWAIRQVAQGRLTLHPAVLRAIVAHLAKTEHAPPPPPLPLTARERDVLRCLAQGASDKDIAQQLYLSVRTVQSHLTHLYYKLGVHSRTAAALVALRAGWFAQEAAGGPDELRSSTETAHAARRLSPSGPDDTL